MKVTRHEALPLAEYECCMLVPSLWHSDCVVGGIRVLAVGGELVILCLSLLLLCLNSQLTHFV